MATRCGFAQIAHFQEAHRQWVTEALTRSALMRDERWPEAIAVGSSAFVDKVKSDLGIKGRYRDVAQMGGTHALREPMGAYALDSSRESDALMLGNTVLWQKNAEAIET